MASSDRAHEECADHESGGTYDVDVLCVRRVEAIRELCNFQSTHGRHKFCTSGTQEFGVHCFCRSGQNAAFHVRRWSLVLPRRAGRHRHSDQLPSVAKHADIMVGRRSTGHVAATVAMQRPNCGGLWTRKNDRVIRCIGSGGLLQPRKFHGLVCLLSCQSQSDRPGQLIQLHVRSTREEPLRNEDSSFGTLRGRPRFTKARFHGVGEPN